MSKPIKPPNQSNQSMKGTDQMASTNIDMAQSARNLADRGFTLTDSGNNLTGLGQQLTAAAIMQAVEASLIWHSDGDRPYETNELSSLGFVAGNRNRPAGFPLVDGKDATALRKAVTDFFVGELTLDSESGGTKVAKTPANAQRRAAHQSKQRKIANAMKIASIFAARDYSASDCRVPGKTMKKAERYGFEVYTKDLLPDLEWTLFDTTYTSPTDSIVLSGDVSIGIMKRDPLQVSTVSNSLSAFMDAWRVKSEGSSNGLTLDKALKFVRDNVAKMTLNDEQATLGLEVLAKLSSHPAIRDAMAEAKSDTSADTAEETDDDETTNEETEAA